MSEPTPESDSIGGENKKKNLPLDQTQWIFFYQNLNLH
jgi:hypothetical protein